MHPVIYDVAVTLDGYISGPDADISAFPTSEDLVADYQQRLAGYATALMGRHTYEFGYRFGLPPGANPYPHMKSVVVSRDLALPGDTTVPRLEPGPDLAQNLRQVIAASDGPVYLCGGGILAGFLLRHGLIDRLQLKRAPVTYGAGTPLFAGATPVKWQLSARHPYPCGAVLETYERAP